MVFCWKCGTEVREDASFCQKCGTPIKPTATLEGKTGFEFLTSEKTAQDHWARRGIAYVIDSVLVGVAVFILVLATVLPPVVLGGGLPFGWGLWFGGIFPLMVLLIPAYFILAEALYAKTLGKHIMGLRVVRRDGKRMDLETSFLRNISKIHPILLILDLAAGLGMRGEVTQKFSDRYAGTVVEVSSQSRIIS
jgi:uncharacterized RDD family membrane protein YckC